MIKILKYGQEADEAVLAQPDLLIHQFQDPVFKAVGSHQQVLVIAAEISQSHVFEEFRRIGTDGIGSGDEGYVRILLGGIFGALYGIFTTICRIHPFLNGFLKLSSAFVMVCISYKQSLRGYIKLLCTLFVSSFCLCGFYMAFSSFAKLQGNGNMLFLNLGYPYIFLIFLLFIWILITGSRF